MTLASNAGGALRVGCPIDPRPRPDLLSARSSVAPQPVVSAQHDDGQPGARGPDRVGERSAVFRSIRKLLRETKAHGHVVAPDSSGQILDEGRQPLVDARDVSAGRRQCVRARSAPTSPSSTDGCSDLDGRKAAPRRGQLQQISRSNVGDLRAASDDRSRASAPGCAPQTPGRNQIVDVDE